MSKVKNSESGISIVELLVVIVIVGVVTTFSLIGVTRTRYSMNLDNSARKMIDYLEKARIDSIRRHATAAANMATITVTSPSTYTITMDFDGTGNLKTRNFSPEAGISFVIPVDPTDGSLLYPTATFDWRGDSAGGESFVLKNNYTSTLSTVYVTDSGDVTLNNTVTIPLPTVTNVSTSSGIDPNAVVNTSPNGCTLTTNVTSLTLKKMKYGTINVTHNSALGNNTVSAATSANTIVPTPSSQNISGNGTVGFSIYSGKKTGNFSVTFSSPCGSKTVGLNITN